MNILLANKLVRRQRNLFKKFLLILSSIKPSCKTLLLHREPMYVNTHVIIS